MAWWDKWLGRSIDLNAQSAPFWRGFFGSATNSGEVVNYDRSMQLDAVWACVNLIANAVKTLPCNVYDETGTKVEADSPLYELLHDMPNLDDTATDFWGMCAVCLCLDGNFFAEKKMSGTRLVGLMPLHPLAVDVKRDERNNRYYEVTERYTDNGKKGGKRRINEDRMLHVRGIVLPGCDRGLSPVEFARHTIGGALAGERVSGQMMKDGLLPQVIVSFDQVLDAKQRADLHAVLNDFTKSGTGGGIMPLEAGATPHTLNVNPKDAQMLESRQYSVEQICRIFGVPPVMIGHAANGTTTWGSGIEQLILQFTKTCLTPMLRQIESAIFRDLLDAKTRKTTVVKFNMEGLLRGDSAARADFLSKMVTNGIYTPDEARAYENKAPEPGGDRLIVQGAMTPLNMLGHNGGPPLDTQSAEPKKRAA